MISIAVFLLIIMTGEIFGSYIIEYNDILDSIKFNKKFKVYGSDEFETHFFAKLQLYR